MTEASGTRPSPHGWRIGTLGGIPVYLGRSWPIIAVVVVVLFGPELAQGPRSTVEGYLIALAYAVLLLLSVLVHEAAHALAARWKGQRVDRIVADMWGGHTVYEAREATPGITALVAVVGPAANLVVGAACWLVLPLVGDDTAWLLLRAVAAANLFVGFFNLLPALPMDGGQIVSALVWRVTGRRSTGLVAAGWLGRLLALGIVVWSALPFVRGQEVGFGALIWVMIALFLWRGASEAIRSGPILDATAGPMLEVLEPVVVVRVDEPVETAVRRATAAPGPAIVVVADASGTPVGTVGAEAALAVPPVDRSRTPVAAVYVTQPDAWVVRLQRGAALSDLLRPMVTSSLSAAAVVDSTSGEVLGVARAERLNDYIESALARRRGR